MPAAPRPAHAIPESVHKMTDPLISSQVRAALTVPSQVTAVVPEPSQVKPQLVFTSQVKSRQTSLSRVKSSPARVPGQDGRHARVLSRHGSRQNFPRGFFGGGHSTQAPADAVFGPRMKKLTAIAILSVWAAHCTPEASSDLPEPCHVSPDPLEPRHVMTASVMAVTILSVWAAHYASEASSVHESAPVPPEMAALAAEYTLSCIEV
ncbi:hypothetical protein M9458_050852 [Cirrhinus mrigala]|uniref:Uncharacterized protein n=1 Tax=Cirrhinus mrigala TaxID=683832 RepID=A0ABD0MZ39_CIRMR